MKRTLFLIFWVVTGFATHGQSNKCLSLFTDIHVNRCVYDRIMHKANGFGSSIGIQINSLKIVKPILEVTGDFFVNTAVLTYQDGHELVRKDFVPSILIGAKFEFFKRLYLKGELGPGWIESNVFLELKPSLGCYIENNQRLSAQISLTHIFENDDAGNEPFGYINFGIIFRIF